MMMEEDPEPTSRIESAVLQGLVNATTSPDCRITAEMPVAALNDLLDLAPVRAVAPRLRVDVVAALFSVTCTLVILAWLAVRLS